MTTGANDTTDPTDRVDHPWDERLVDALLDRLQDVAVLVFDEDLRFTAAGGSGLTEQGWDPSELVGRRLGEVATGDAATSLAEHYRATLAGAPRRFRHRGVRRPERTSVVDVIPLRRADGTVEGGLVIARDVTEPLAHLTELTHSEQLLRQLSTSSGDMLALYDPDGVYLAVSLSSRELFGWAPEELIGTSSYDLFHPEDLAAIQQVHTAVLQQPDTGTATYRLRCADSSYRWVEVNGHRNADPITGEVTSIQCTTRDITRRHTAEARLLELNLELQRSNQELERFASVASHDLRSPLATTRGLLDTLPMLPEVELPPQAQDLLDRARGQLTRLAGTVDSLLELAQVGVGALDWETIDPRELIDGVLDALGPDVTSAAAEVTFGDLEPIVGDRRQLHVLVQNLISNALRYRHPDRALQVHIATHRSADRWQLVVTDTGRGVRPDDRERIFLPFVRAQSAGTVAGVGIGLATGERIATRHGGTITVEERAAGARFVVTVPIREAEGHRAGGLPSTVADPGAVGNPPNAQETLPHE